MTGYFAHYTLTIEQLEISRRKRVDAMLNPTIWNDYQRILRFMEHAATHNVGQHAWCRPSNFVERDMYWPSCTRESRADCVAGSMNNTISVVSNGTQTAQVL